MSEAQTIINDNKQLKCQSAQYGSDIIIDTLNQYQIEFITCNPGATIRGLHDSLINYHGEKNAELVLCCHEEIAVAIAHGYAKAKNRFMAVLLHSNVGLQHASMAIFNAWCDRVPLLLLGGIGPMDAAERRPWIDWIHTSNQPATIIRDYVKWHDEPRSVKAAIEAIHRACRITNTEPKAPVFVGIDALIQENDLTDDIALANINKLQPPRPPQADQAALEQTAQLLCQAENPLIIADYMGRNPEAVAHLVHLAQTLSIPVLDLGGRYNFPNNHPLCLTGAEDKLIPQADVILMLEVQDVAGVLETHQANTDAKTIHVTLADNLISQWAADYQKLFEVDMTIAADSAVFLPALTQLCTKQVEASKTNRAVKLERLHQSLRRDWLTQAQQQSSQQPLRTDPVLLEIWQAIKAYPWVLANHGSVGIGHAVRKLWEFDQPGRYLGFSGGAGLGYGLGAAIGAALAYQNSDTICINLQCDGDLLFTPSALWTAAHHQVALLTIVMNNRSYGNTQGHSETIASFRHRPISNASRGNSLADIPVDYIQLADSFGIKTFGQVTDLKSITPTITKAMAYIEKNRKPALVEMIIL